MKQARATILLAGGGTGGHVFPMVAVADALALLDPGLRLVFVGTERGIETRVVPERGYELELMRVLPLRGAGVGGALRGTLRAAALLPEGRALLQRLNPRAVFSIGGYAAGPVSLAARFARLPLALMEPNSVIGLANRLIAPLVTRAYTAFPESERHFRKGRVLRTGVPIRLGFRPAAYARGAGPLRVLVLGGSQGARALNHTLPEALALCETPLKVVHQCGAGNDQALRERYRSLGAGPAADVRPFIDDMPEALACADLVVGRAGASAVAEICAVGRPSILIPYPHAAGQHQLGNARSLERGGGAVCVPESELSPQALASEIDRLATGDGLLAAMASAARDVGRPDAAFTIARDLLELAGLPAATPSSRGPEPGPTDPKLDLQEAL